MKVEDRSKYKLVFSVSTHPQLGVMVHPYVIAYTSLDTLSLTYQKVFSGNASYYTKLSSEELELIALLDATMAENIVRTFSPVQKIRPKEFFRKHLPKTLLTEKVRPYIEKHLSAFFSKLPSNSKSLYVADEINPAAIPIRIQSEFTKVLFHFRRNENGTSYFVTIKHVEERIPFMKLGGLMPTTTPARLIVNGVMYKFYDFVDGAKIAVFLNKKFIHVKPESEKVYYDKFVKPLLETAPVFSQGFEIENTREEATPILQLTQVGEAYGFDLRIKYSNQSFPFHQNKLFHVKYNWTADGPKYIRYKRSKIWESNRVTALEQLGLINKQGSFFSLSNSSLPQTIQWLRSHKEVLEAGHFILNSKLEQTYNFQETRINYKISDKIDWFDLNVTITVGEYEISFSKVIAQMKKGLYEIDLPNGEIFVFPDEWIQLGESLSKAKHKSNTFSVKKYQVDILGLIKSKEIKAHLNSLVKIRKEKPCPTFNGTLRPYQIDGLSWLMFLFNNRFGGILADDMGLGKTVQTLAFLQLVKQRIKKENSSVKFLLIAPTSLLYNWSHEAQEFSPDLKCHIHSGTKRQKSADKLEKFDLIITSYGLIRNDSELFQSLDFDVTILDESQNIKNHSTKTTQYINKIESRCRVALTGTPIENSIRDLWSQMNFLNKGLLGSLKDFDEKYARPIEKGQDEKKAEELRKKIKPFLLRRTKSEVATELPPITEKIIYCEMTERQAEIYEETKSKYRNNILEVIEEKGLQKSKFNILQGLSKLRQLANHPKLVDSEYSDASGKHEILLEKIRNAISDGHKVLIFSQFVSYLDIIQRDLEKLHVNLFKLTGSTSKEKRATYVSEFQKTTIPSAFLISLKAGGTGLNLTSADYVFIVDPWWNPAAEAQARDRTHRIGQIQNVFSYKFITRESIEEKIISLQQKKKGYSKDIIMSENNILKNLDTNELEFLFA